MGDDIFVIDDDPVAIQLLGRILEDLGQMRFSTNGEDAIRLAHASPPDLVLSMRKCPL